MLMNSRAVSVAPLLAVLLFVACSVWALFL
ncbi:Uncharacterised protein [Edwardsiella tarda]|nr:Uncharacterised protein [Edwardsiella tarda]